MFCNLLRTSPIESPNPQLNDVPRPSDYELGSVEWRVAARALLEAKVAGDQQNKLRVVVEHMRTPCQPGSSTCQRYFYTNGTLMEILHLGASGELSMDQVEPFNSSRSGRRKDVQTREP